MINEKVLGHKEYIKNTVKSGKYSRLFFSSEFLKWLTIEVKNLTQSDVVLKHLKEILKTIINKKG